MKMNKVQKLFLLIFITFSLFSNNLYSQIERLPQSASPFYFDAVCFKGIPDSLSRVDIYVLVPYQTIKFVKSDEIYAGQYEILIKVLDSSKKKIEEKRIQKKLQESDYYSANGASAKFDYSQTIFQIPKGNYDIEVLLIDNLSNLSYTKSRNMTLINFGDYKFSISGILLVSSIEESSGKFAITPHISDNIGDLIEGYFSFFEVYNNAKLDSVDFIYELLDSKGEALDTGKRIRKFAKDSTIQTYLKIPYNSKMSMGTYLLRVIALKPSNEKSYLKSDILSIAERSIRFYHYISGFAIKDIEKAAKQMRYVASQKEIDYILLPESLSEKQDRFSEFWKKIDPTPNTERNEAFEDYYSRVEYANKEFKSYTEGWMTDMGLVFIVYGKPISRERSLPRTDGKKYEIWTYINNRQFIFVDNSGMEDFRLSNSTLVTDKYHYNP